jgi:hypothetical protein
VLTVDEDGDVYLAPDNTGGGGFWVANGNDITNTNTEDVGIGIAAPDNKLTIDVGTMTASNGIHLISDASNLLDLFLSIEYDDANNRVHYLFDDGELTSAHTLRLQSYNALAFNTNQGNERMRILSDGRVGINRNSVTDAATFLEVKGRIRSAGFPAADGTADSNSAFELRNRWTGGADYVWRIYTAAVGGGGGVTPNGFDIWEYPPVSPPPSTSLARFRIDPSKGEAANPASIDIDSKGRFKPFTVAKNIAGYPSVLHLYNENGAASTGTRLSLQAGTFNNTFLGQNNGDGGQTIGSAVDTILLNTYSTGSDDVGRVLIGSNNQVMLTIAHIAGNPQVGIGSGVTSPDSTLQVFGNIHGNEVYAGGIATANKVCRQDGTNCPGSSSTYPMNLQVIRETGNNGVQSVTASCTDGRKLLSGGCISSTQLKESYPEGDTTWRCVAAAGGTITSSFVLCGYLD